MLLGPLAVLLMHVGLIDNALALVLGDVITLCVCRSAAHGHENQKYQKLLHLLSFYASAEACLFIAAPGGSTLT